MGRLVAVRREIVRVSTPGPPGNPGPPGPPGSGGQGFRPEDFGDHAPGYPNDDTPAIRLAFAAAAAAGGVVELMNGKTYGCSGDLLQKNGVAVRGAGANAYGNGSSTRLKAIDSTFRYKWGSAVAGGANFPAELRDVIIDGNNVAGAGHELLRVEAVDSTMTNVQVLNSAGDGAGFFNAQNCLISNLRVDNCPTGSAVKIQNNDEIATNGQACGHLVFIGGHITRSYRLLHVDYEDNAGTGVLGFWAHDNEFWGTIFEQYQANADLLIKLSDGETRFHGCTITASSGLTTSASDCVVLIENQKRNALPTYATFDTCDFGGGSVGVGDLVRAKSYGAVIAVRIYGKTQVSNNNQGYFLCDDRGPSGGLGVIGGVFGAIDGLTTATDGTGLKLSRGLNGGSGGSFVTQLQQPIRGVMDATQGRFLQVRRVGDTGNRWSLDRDGGQRWENGAGSLVGSITNAGTGLFIAGENVMQVAAFTTATRPLASNPLYLHRLILDTDTAELLWSDGTTWHAAGGGGAVPDALEYKGVVDASTNPNYPAAGKGDTYKISVAGKIGGASGPNVEVGDLIICLADGTAAGTHAAVGASWDIIQGNVDGAVSGPPSSTAGRLASFSGTSGKVIQDAGVAPSTDTTLAANSDAKLPTEKAVKSYVDGSIATVETTPGPTGPPGPAMPIGSPSVASPDPGATLSVTPKGATMWKVFLSGNITLTATDLHPGQFLYVSLRQNSSGGAVVTLDTSWGGRTAAAASMSTAANNIDTLIIWNDGDGTYVKHVMTGVLPPTFTPAALTNQHDWFTADSLPASSIDAEVLAWENTYASGADMTAPGGATTGPKLRSLNGKKYLEFNGSSQYLESAFASISPPFTIAMVVRVNETSGVVPVVNGPATGNTAVSTDGTTPRYWQVNSSGNTQTATGDWETILIHVKNDGTGYLRRDGSQTTVNTGGAPLTGLRIARQVALSTNYGQIDLAELILLTKTPAGTDIADIENYLNPKRDQLKGL